MRKPSPKAALLAEEKHQQAKEPEEGAVETGMADSHAGKTMAVPAAAGPGDVVNEAAILSDYERQRLDNIQRNQEVLRKMGLAEAARAVAPEPKLSKPRGIARVKPKAATVTRRSLRHAGQGPAGEFAGGVHAEAPDGSVVVMVAGEAVRYTARKPGLGEEDATELAARLANLTADLPFESLNAARSTDLAFIARLRSAGSAPAADPAPVSALARAELPETGVAKVTKRDIVHIAFQPRGDAAIVSAADKQGHLGVWDVAKAEEVQSENGDGDDGGAEDGVLLLRPHSQYVSGLKWVNASVLLTASYEGTIRRLDLAHSTTQFELVCRLEDHEVSAMDVDAAGVVAVFGDNTGEDASPPAPLHLPPPTRLPPAPRALTAPGGFGVVDCRERRLATGTKSRQLHDRKINMLSIDPARGHAMASSATDGEVRLWDLRALSAGRPAKPVAVLHHAKSCQGASWAPDGSGRLLTTCYDNCLRSVGTGECRDTAARAAR